MDCKNCCASELTNDEWQRLGHKVPLLVNLQPAGEYLGEDYHRAGGVPAVMGQLIKAGMLPHPNQITANGKSMGENCTDAEIINTDVIKPIETQIKVHSGFINLSGILIDSAIMKTSVISQDLQIAICQRRRSECL